MRRPGIIRCKDCLAWEDRRHCKLRAPNETVITGEIDLDTPKTPPDWYCLQAVPRNPGTCEDCCYWDPAESRPEKMVEHMWRGNCLFEPTPRMFYAGHSCRHWRPCRKSEGE